MAGSEGSGAAVPANRAVADVVAPGLRILFCGINPGLASAAAGLHFARPGNRFWKVLHASGLTPTLLDPSGQAELLALGLGITNFVARPSAAASEVTLAELRDGARALEARVETLAPAHVAILGVGAYRRAFRRPAAPIGEQPERLGCSRLWVLPNPSGLQARYQLPELAQMYGALSDAASGGR